MMQRTNPLCYTRDEKWSFSHKCPDRNLMILQVEEYASDSEEEGENQEVSVVDGGKWCLSN